MRPSAISLLSEIRAISRRTGSKALTITTPGVSSMMTSTPVAFSSARMLRPSRPMMRPFISSLGMSTVLVVASAVWAAAKRWIEVISISLAFYVDSLGELPLVFHDQGALLVRSVLGRAALRGGLRRLRG